MMRRSSWLAARAGGGPAAPEGSSRRPRPRALRPAVLRVAILAAAAMLPAAGMSADAAVEVPGRIVLELTDAGARALRAGTLEVPLPAGGEALDPHLEPLFVSRTGPLSRFALLTFDAAAGGPGNREWIGALTGSAEVLRGQPDLMVEMAALPDDPYLLGAGGLPPQLHLYNPGGLSLEATRAWPFVPADREVVVAIVDSGVDWRHPDLGGADPPGSGVIWTNAAEFGGLPGVDDDGNGYVDDALGWDWVDLPASFPGGISVHPDEDDADEDNDPSDFAGHGTQAAGYVAALTDNAAGIAGAAPGARIMCLRAGWLTSTNVAVVYMTYCAQAIEYAALNGAQVINCSWDSSSILGMAEAVDLAIDDYDVVIVASAGNQNSDSGTNQYLGLRDDVVAVGGILFTGRKAGLSNYGDWVEIAAFYSGTSTTWFNRVTGVSSYSSPNGTSFAAPQVTGQAALLRLAQPGATAAEVRLWITSTGQDLSALDPTYGSQLGGGLADYAASVRAAVGGWDGARGGRRLTGHRSIVDPTALTGAQVAFLGADMIHVEEPADGSAAAGWTGGIPGGDASTFPLSVPWEAVGVGPQLLVWTEGSLLNAAFAPGDVPDGWPVALPEGYGQPAAALESGEPSATIYVPHGDGVLVVRHDASAGVKTSSLDLPVDRIAVGQLDGDAAWEVAGIDAAGVVRVHDPDDSGGATTWSVAVGGITAGPVIAELDRLAGGVVVVAASDASSPDVLQKLHELGQGGALHEKVTFSGPPVRHLSGAGFGDETAPLVVAADEAGGIRTFDAGPPLVDAGGPLAGEVLTADLDGNGTAELVALRADGTLFAWDLVPGPVPGFALRPGFPRRFPHGAAEPPLVVDESAAPFGRYMVVADTTGRLWSLPIAGAGSAAAWPGVRGGSLRNGFLSYDRATPVAASAVLRRSGDELCWSGTGLGEFVSLRLRAVETGTVLWEGAPADDGCADPGRRAGGGSVALEGLDRASGWEVIASLDPAVTPAFRPAAAHPNPFGASTRIDWAGSRGPVRVQVFDVTGRRLLERVVAPHETGFTWDGRDGRGRTLPPGLYFLRVVDAGSAAVRRVVKLP